MTNVIRRGLQQHDMYCVLMYCVLMYCVLMYCVLIYCVLMYCVLMYCVIYHYFYLYKGHMRYSILY